MTTAPPAVPTSNGVPVPFDAAHAAAMRESDELLGDGPALRRRLAQDGYLLLRGVLDVDRLRLLRRRYFSLFDPSYLVAGSDPADGLFSGRRPEGLPAHGTAGHPAHDVVRSDAFLALCADERLGALAAAALGAPATQLPRRILRHFDRSRALASRAHIDLTYLDRGSDRLVTAWFPVGDCPLDTGGLVYLEGSHRLAPEELAGLRGRSDRDDPRPLSHDLGWVAERLRRRWLWTDYRCGDVVLHSPHIVHASLDTRTDTMRLSADLRWLADGETADDRWSLPWSGDDGN